MKYKLQISISNAQNLLDLIEYYNKMLKQFRGYINWYADYEEILEMGKDFFIFYMPDLRFVASEICYQRWRDESRLAINRKNGQLEYYIEMKSKIESEEDIADTENALRRTKQCISLYQRFIDDVMKFDTESGASVTDSVKVKDSAINFDVIYAMSDDEFADFVDEMITILDWYYEGEMPNELEAFLDTPNMPTPDAVIDALSNLGYDKLDEILRAYGANNNYSDVIDELVP